METDVNFNKSKSMTTNHYIHIYVIIVNLKRYIVFDKL